MSTAMRSLLPKKQNKRRVTFADHDEFIVEKKPREQAPEIYEPFQATTPRNVVQFKAKLETLFEDEDKENLVEEEPRKPTLPIYEPFKSVKSTPKASVQFKAILETLFEDDDDSEDECF